jgi:hypothetical protein
MRSVTGVRAVPHLQGRRIDLTWRNPPAAAFSGGAPLVGIRIVRRERTFPRTADDGDLAYDGPVISALADSGLKPLTTFYYTVFAVDGLSAYHADEGSQVVAFATENYHLAERLYKLLPAVHQRYDLPLGAAELQQLNPAVVSALTALPAGLRGRGQLWRFFHAAAPLDLMRSLAEGLRHLHDLDLARPEFLPPLAHWAGWELDRTLPVFAQRNEIRFAPRLYRGMGTVPTIRTMVNRYTGWYAQVAEFAQHIMRSNAPAQLNIFAMLEEAGGWRGPDDAAPLLGFGTGNSDAAGTGTLPALLVSTTAEPFALRPQMEMAVTADGRIPVAVLFRPGDFADMTNATAAEVVAVLNRTLSEVTATALANGRIELRSHTLGPDSSLRVEQYAASLVTLEGAPHGRLATFADDTPGQQLRIRVFYEIADPLAPVTAQAVTHALSGQPLPVGVLPGQSRPAPSSAVGSAPVVVSSQPQGHIRYKTFRRGAWGESFLLQGSPDVAQGDPAAGQLLDGRIFVAWVDNPTTGVARLRWMLGTVRTPQPARLTGQRSQPFRLIPGMRLLFQGNWPQPEGFEFAALDFAIPEQATAAEIANALNARLGRISATVQPDQTLRLETITVGGDERLEIDLQHSSAAQALGFDANNAVASGDWGDEIDWLLPQDVTSAAPGRHADLHAVIDAAGGVRLFWSTHVGSQWDLVTSRWDGVTWSALETLAASPGGNREPCAVLDNSNRIWLFWAQRQSVSTPEADIWTLRRRVFDPVTSTWDPEAAITNPPVGRAADREPGVVRVSNGDLRVFFRSDRAGGVDLWSVTVTPATAVVSAPTAVTAGHFGDHAPAPILMADGALWLLHRTDRSVPLSRVATRLLPTLENRITFPASMQVESPPGLLHSVRAPDTGTIRRFAGSTTIMPTDTARIRRRGRWDDLLAYTPQKPLGEPWEESLQDGEWYTRGTVGLVLSQVIPQSPLAQQRVERLRAVLERFLPINVRAVVILAPRVDVEFVYQPNADLEETFLDNHPDVERFIGLEDTAAAALPEWGLLLSTTPSHVSADVADLTTLRRRTYFPPPV